MAETEVIRELLTYLGYDVNETGFKRAENQFKSLTGLALELADRVNRIWEGMKGLAERASQGAGQAYATSKRLGLTTTEVQELAFAQGQTTEMSGALETALFQLQRRAEQARLGNAKLSASFVKWGVHINDAHGKLRPLADLLEEVSAKFKNLSEDKRAAAAFELFGKGGSRIAPFLLKDIGAERQNARDLGVVLSPEDIEQAREYGKQIRTYDTLWGAVQQRAGAKLIPFFSELKKNSIAFLEKWQGPIIEAFDKLGKFLLGTLDVWRAFTKAIWDNRRALEVLGLIIAGIGLGIASTFIPAIVAAGTAALIAGAGMAEAAVFAAAAWLAAAAPFVLAAAALAGIALIIEDIYVYLSGGESLIGEFFDAFVKSPGSPNDHWILKVIRWFVQGIYNAITSANAFFDGFFLYAEELGGIWEALKDGFAHAIDWWKAKLLGWVDWALEELKRLPLISGAITGFNEAGHLADDVNGWIDDAIGRRRPGTLAAHAADQLGGRGVPAPLALAGGTVTTNQQITGGPVSIVVQAPAGASPKEIADQTADEFMTRLDDHYREMGRNVEPRGER